MEEDIKESVAGILESGSKVLLMRRLPGGSVGGLWEFPGGKVENGESLCGALKREWLEEMEISIECGDKLAETSFLHNQDKFKLTALEVILSLENFNPILREHDKYMWADKDKLKELPIVESDMKLVEILFPG